MISLMTRVRVVGDADRYVSKHKLKGITGVVIGHLTEDCGASLSDPLHRVKFDGRAWIEGEWHEVDVFWEEELEVIE